MILKPILDFEKLLAPFSGPKPTGVFLRGDDSGPEASFYYDLRSAYNQAKSDEAKQEQAKYLPPDDPGAQVKPPDWDEVRDQAIKILAERSKDLWVAARLIEALFRTDGFPGLCEGLRLARRLCEEYWQDLYPPRLENTGFEERVHDFGPLLSNEKLLRLPILQASLTENRDFTVFDYQGAVELETLKSKDPEAFEKRKSEGAITLADFESEVQYTKPEFFRNLAHAIRECLEEFDALVSALDERLAADEGHPLTLPSAASVRDALDTCGQAVRHIAPAAFADEAAPAETSADAGEGQPSAAAPGAQAVVTAPGAIATRQQAFQVLEQVAKFFEKTEPQSFIPFSLRQIIRRGALPLPELLAELIASDESRRDFSRLTGVPEPSEKSE